MASRGFDSYDFGSSTEWLRYYDNIFPQPSYSQLTKIKQKWYREHVDKAFNPNPPGPSASNSSNPSSAPRPQASRNPQNRTPPSPLQLFQTVLFSLSIPAMLYGKALHLLIAGHLAGLIHYHNMPRMNLDYWRPVISDDNMHSIVFALLFLVLPTSNVWLVPAYIGVLVYVPDVVIGLQYAPKKFKDIAQKFDDSKLKLLQARADCEVWVGFALVILWVIGFGHWITPVIFWQYTRMRYILNYFSKVTFANLRVKGDQVFMTRPGFSVVWEKVKAGCDWLCKLESSPSSASSCEIF